MNPLFIPAATDADFLEIAALGREIWREHYTPIIGAAQVEYMLEKFQSAKVMKQQADDGYTYVKAYADGRLAGYCGVQPQPDSSLFLSKLYIHKEFRGRGLGRALLGRAVGPFVMTGGVKVWLTVNRHNAGSIAAYKKMGFAVEREQVSDIGNGYVMDDYVMRRIVAAG